MLSSSNLFRKRDAKPSTVDSPATGKHKKCSLTWGMSPSVTILTMTESCVSCLRSGVQSKMMANYLDVFISFTMASSIFKMMEFSSFCIFLPQIMEVTVSFPPYWHNVTASNLAMSSTSFWKLPLSGLFHVSVDPLKARFLSAKDWIIADVRPHTTFFSQPQQVPSTVYLLSALSQNGPPRLSMLPC